MLLIKTSELQQSVGFAITSAEEDTGRIKHMIGNAVTNILNDGELLSIEEQQDMRKAAKELTDKLKQLVVLRDYVKFAEESGCETVHLSVEMFALVKHNLPAR